MGRTSFLVAIAAALLLMEFFPNEAGVIKWGVIVLGGGYLAARALLTYPKIYREARRQKVERAEDGRSFQAYQRELAAIRTQYDSVGQSARDAASDTAYEAELAALHARYRPMLERKFGTR